MGAADALWEMGRPPKLSFWLDRMSSSMSASLGKQGARVPRKSSSASFLSKPLGAQPGSTVESGPNATTRAHTHQSTGAMPSELSSRCFVLAQLKRASAGKPNTACMLSSIHCCVFGSAHQHMINRESKSGNPPPFRFVREEDHLGAHLTGTPTPSRGWYRPSWARTPSRG